MNEGGRGGYRGRFDHTHLEEGHHFAYPDQLKLT